MDGLQQLRAHRIQALAEGKPHQVNFRAQASDDSDMFDIYLYDMIDDWFGVTAKDIIMALVEADGADVVVHINSPGGYAHEALAMYNTMRNYSGSLTTRVEGMAASAASVVMLAGDPVVIEPSALVMVHDAINITIGPAAEHERQAGILNKVSDVLAGIYSAKAGDTVEFWREQMTQNGTKGTWYAGQEAVDVGLVDQVADEPAATAVASARWDRSLFGAEVVHAPAARKPAVAATVDMAALHSALTGGITWQRR